MKELRKEPLGRCSISVKKSNGGSEGLLKNYAVQNKKGDEMAYMKFESRAILNYNR